LARTDDDDSVLMVRAASGELAAFEELVRRNQRNAWALAWRVLGDAAEAEDVVQDAFLKIYKAASRYRPTARFRTYLYAVITRLCLDRSQKKRPEYTADLPDVPDAGRGPETLLITSELTEAVRRCLEGLPTNQRIAISLRHDDAMTYEEIAEVLQVSSKAVDSLLQRARSALRECLAHVR
jgi:RNA polymerase sigma-70 factor, ECF subfamily